MGSSCKIGTDALVLVAALAACGGSGGGSAAVDAPGGTVDAAGGNCELEPGELHFFTSIGVGGLEDGVDLDGDGAIDNQLGKLPAAVRSSVRDTFDRSIDSGEFLAGTYLVGVEPPGARDDTSVALDVVSLRDGDDPQDVSNDQSGTGTFWIFPTSIDLDCGSKTRTPGTLVADVFTGSSARFEIPLITGTGTIDLVTPHFEMAFDEGHRHVTGKVSSYWTLCSLAAQPLPIEDNPSATVLAFLVNDPSFAEAARPDGDFDGDGLESVEGDGVGILRCTDGDGTVIDGPDCACRPEIADGLSVTLLLEAVSARALGIL